MKEAVYTLKEGEAFTESFRLTSGARCTIFPRCSESVDLFTIRLYDPNSCTIVPKVHSDPVSLHFAATYDGYYALKVVLETIAQGKISAKVGVTIRPSEASLTGRNTEKAKDEAPSPIP